MRARKGSFRFSGIPEFGNRNSEAGGSADIGLPGATATHKGLPYARLPDLRRARVDAPEAHLSLAFGVLARAKTCPPSQAQARQAGLRPNLIIEKRLLNST